MTVEKGATNLFQGVWLGAVVFHAALNSLEATFLGNGSDLRRTGTSQSILGEEAAEDRLRACGQGPPGIRHCGCLHSPGEKLRGESDGICVLDHSTVLFQVLRGRSLPLD